MTETFTSNEWELIFDHLALNSEAYDLPEVNGESIIFGSWNIRKFGQFSDKDGPKRSAGATRLLQIFCSRCDLISLQEVQTDLTSVRHLLNALNDDLSRDYRLISSDVTGRIPGGKGLSERLAFIYDAKKIDLGELASDLSVDQTAIVSNVNQAILETHENFREEQDGLGIVDWVSGKWLFTKLFVKKKLNNFITFIRSPYLVTFRVLGKAGAFYDLSIVNAHLQYGRRVEREREFFFLLEWLVKATSSPKDMEPPITLLMADLNLDFSRNNRFRQNAIAKTLTDFNSAKSKAKAVRVNFPFLDDHPTKGELKTNARQAETFDHIAIFSRQDNRFPWGRYNNTAGTSGTSGFDFGMFNFVELFKDAGPGLSGGALAIEKFEHDVSDHMPIYLRMPLPSPDQAIYSKDGISN